MIYRFIIISDEAEDFMREIKIDADDKFLAFHEAILKACGYTNDDITYFTICENGWEKVQDITLEDFSTSSEQDSYVMKSTRLSEFLQDEKQHLLYTFDNLGDRKFFIELTQISKGHLDEPIISRQQGEPPVQHLDFDELMMRNPIVQNDSDGFVDEDMTDDSFSEDDLEMEGLDLMDEKF